MTDTKAITERVQHFRQAEEGAVTVDWVVLAAAVALLAVPIGLTLNTSVSTAASGIAERVTESFED